MKAPRQTKCKFFHPEIAAALIILFDLNNTDELLPCDIAELGRRVLPDMQGLTRNKAYNTFKARLQNVPAQIAPFYGRYPEVEEKRWESKADLEIIRKLRQKVLRHQIATTISVLYTRNARLMQLTEEEELARQQQ
jgi:hypothetical protein